ATTQVALRNAKGRKQQGRPSFGYFSWPRKKSTSPAGAKPGQQNKKPPQACTKPLPQPSGKSSKKSTKKPEPKPRFSHTSF
ncbi:MAG: hypothetical protein RR899_15505, partial [Comamonas sp.]